MVSIFGRKPSENVVDAREGGSAERRLGGAAMAGLGIVGVAGVGAAGVAMTGVDLTLCYLGLGPCEVTIEDTRKAELDAFAAVILGDTERVWTSVFTEVGGAPYRPTTLVLHDTSQTSRCGLIRAGRGPVYCVEDEKIFLDLSFFDRMVRREAAGGPVRGDFSAAFVIAHEVSHHVQKLTGDYARFAELLANPDAEDPARLTVRLELQADCLAGVWTAKADAAFGLLEAGDIEEGITTASAFGDDAGAEAGMVAERAGSHGSGVQRAAWFRRGLDTPALASCDTWTPAFEAL